LRLEPGSTKNQEGRLVFLTPELKAGIADQLARVKALEREMSTIVPWLFPYLHGCHQGDRIKSFRKTWTKACREAGCPGKLRHDLRRIAARNMINLGVPDRVTMALLGHKTTSMLHRYFIVSPADLQDVARRLSDKGTDNRAHLGDGRIISN